VSVLITVFVIAVAAVIVFAAIGDYKDSFDEKKAEEIRDTVLSYVAECYALEGKYPTDLEYLEDNYGLMLDRDKYVYHYLIFASNFLPDVKVIPMNQEGN
jgi:hypothetical protein